MPSSSANYGIRDVWADNMAEEFRKIRQLVDKYPFVAMVSELSQAEVQTVYYYIP